MALFSKTLIGDVGSAVLNEVAAQLDRALCTYSVGAAGFPPVPGVDIATGLGGSAGFGVGLGRFGEDVFVKDVSFSVVDYDQGPGPSGVILTEAGSVLALAYTNSAVPDDPTAGGATITTLWSFTGNGNPACTIPVGGYTVVPGDGGTFVGIASTGTTTGLEISQIAAPVNPTPNAVNTYSNWVIPAGTQLYLLYSPVGADDAEVSSTAGQYFIANVSVSYCPIKDLITPTQNYVQTMRSWSNKDVPYSPAL